MVTFTPDFMRWHLFRVPERVQVLLCILLHTDEAGIIDPYVIDKLHLICGLSAVTVSRSLEELASEGIIELGVCNDAPDTSAIGIRLLRLPDGVSTIDQPSSTVQCNVTPQPSPQEPPKAKKKSKSTRQFVKPTIEEIAAYVKENGYSVDPEYFFNYEEMVGWVVGKSRKPMKDWKAAVRWQENSNRKKKTDNQLQPSGVGVVTRISSYEQQRQSSRSLYLAAETGKFVQGPDGGPFISQSDDRTLAQALSFIPAEGDD